MLLKKIVLKLIRLYQKTISFDHGWLGKTFPEDYHKCWFYPSCSEYTYQVIIKYWLFKGWKKGIWRILRCNPWNKNKWVDKP